MEGEERGKTVEKLTIGGKGEQYARGGNCQGKKSEHKKKKGLGQRGGGGGLLGQGETLSGNRILEETRKREHLEHRSWDPGS